MANKVRSLDLPLHRDDRGAWISPAALRQCFGFSDVEMLELATELARNEVNRHPIRGYALSPAMDVATRFARGY